MKKSKNKQPLYSRKDLDKEFPNDNVCLDYLFKYKYPNQICPICWEYKSYYRVSARKCYSCAFCGHQISPMAGTIFHKSSTPLTDWFYAIHMFSISKNGVSAAELQRALKVMYKTAWRMATSIRKLMNNDGTPLSGTVEVDEGYIGGSAQNIHKSKRAKSGLKQKTVVLGMAERQGRVAMRIVNHARISSILPVLDEIVAKNSTIYSDSNPVYMKQLPRHGYTHKSVNHRKKEYVRGDVHTNTVESLWSLIKRSFDGTYHFVSPAYLELYLAEFVFRYNHRNAPVSMFHALLRQL